MALDMWLAYVSTVLVLMLAPGPSHLLMLGNSLGNGFRRSLATAGGDLSANLVQMSMAGAGLAATVRASGELFWLIKWAGVAYLVYLGGRQLWLARPGVAVGGQTRRSLAVMYGQGFLTSAANPKAVVFFAALFPQFLAPERATAPQLVALGATYLVLDATFLCLYGGLADRLRARIDTRAIGRAHRCAGALLIGAAVLLGLRDLDTAATGSGHD